jgi:4-hydroxythreonine-4-phosphate dehydrogenase
MKTLAATVGDPLSIGPEVAVHALSDFLKRTPDTQIFLCAPRDSMAHFKTWRSLESSGRVTLIDPGFKLPSKPGKKSGEIALRCLETAVRLCMMSRAQVLVTGPVDKSLIALSDKAFRGQTEWIQKSTKSLSSLMLLAGHELRVAVATTHIPLAKVAQSLNQERIVEAVKLLSAHLQSGGISHPRIGVCGLNPHAGDSGLIGTEEKKIILPALQTLKRRLKNVAIFGPLAADSLFVHAHQRYDAVLALYHDQGLIPLKMRHFYDAINITLGLPFLRTSVDHGTAFDLVGTGKASWESYAHALDYASHWIQQSHTNPRRSRK